MQKVLFVDFDGVIRHWREPDAPIEIAHGLPVGAIAHVAFHPTRLLPAITGKISDEAWRDQIANHLLKVHPESAAHDAVAHWSSKRAEIDVQVLALLRGCNAVARVVLVTNATSRLRKDLLELGLTDCFSEIINSSEMGVAKPDPKFFSRALDRCKIAPTKALLVDDTLENVQSAARLGISAHQFVNCSAMESFMGDCGFPTAEYCA